MEDKNYQKMYLEERLARIQAQGQILQSQYEQTKEELDNMNKYTQVDNPDKEEIKEG
jgi:vacuolar-type H+-ATPase subunit E/Vma4